MSKAEVDYKTLKKDISFKTIERNVNSFQGDVEIAFKNLPHVIVLMFQYI